jgi:hypothetical protein
MPPRRLPIFVCLLALLLSACQPAPTVALPPATTPTTLPTATGAPEQITFPKIDRRPRPVTIEDWQPWAGQTLEMPPTYEAGSGDMWQMDLRTQDLSRLDLRDSFDDLLNALFDDRTIWPPVEQMPEGFDWKQIMELGKEPGLGVRKLHERGITGRNVGIAIIDMPMLVTHQEYVDRLRFYEEINVGELGPSEMHGPAVVSIAAGKTVGVAPEASLYCIATYPADWDANGDWTFNFAYLAQALQRIVEINQQLPEGAKIRAISISNGWRPQDKGYDEVVTAVKAARDAGMLVVSNSKQDPFGFMWRDGLGRDPRSDPDDFNSYERAAVVQNLSPKFPESGALVGHFLVPLDSRTAASPVGNDEYAFYRRGGESWGPPYLAGLFALAAQVDPSITPERFWDLAARTGQTIEITRDGQASQLGPILDPVALIEALK